MLSLITMELFFVLIQSDLQHDLPVRLPSNEAWAGGRESSFEVQSSQTTRFRLVHLSMEIILRLAMDAIHRWRKPNVHRTTLDIMKSTRMVRFRHSLSVLSHHFYPSAVSRWIKTTLYTWPRSIVSVRRRFLRISKDWSNYEDESLFFRLELLHRHLFCRMSRIHFECDCFPPIPRRTFITIECSCKAPLLWQVHRCLSPFLVGNLPFDSNSTVAVLKIK